jgi:hypothetical protein
LEKPDITRGYEIQFKSQPSAGKIILTLFWDMERAIWVHFTSRGETVNSQNYRDVLRTKLNPAIRLKRHENLRKDVILLRDSQLDVRNSK